MARYVLKELFGRASSADNYIYVSDGGHFDNLGLYELVRRECRLIIVSDAEQDDGYRFHALGTAIRRCWIDFKARIEIDVANLMPQTPGGHCRDHCAIGAITYADGARGWIVYLKASWTGDEDTDLKQYRGYNPAFPHHSTGDQWFSESQFESYRKLGYHVAWNCLHPTVTFTTRIDKFKDPAALGAHLDRYWKSVPLSGSEAFVKNTDMLLSIWKDLQTNAQLAFLDPIVLPSTRTADEEVKELNDRVQPPADPNAARAGEYLCQRMFQLMENVYLDLDLLHDHSHPDQSGWIALFKHWASFKYIHDQWRRSRSTYGSRFRAFWRQTLMPSRAADPDEDELGPL